MSSMFIRPMRSIASSVSPPECGMKITLGWRKIGWSVRRLLGIGIDRSSGEVAGRERRVERVEVDDLAAREVEEPRAGLHAGEPGGVDQPALPARCSET